MEPNWTSVIPPLLAVILAFLTREAVVSLIVACVVGVVLLGHGIQGFPDLLTRALGNEDFIWVCSIEVAIGVLVAFLQGSGAIALFRKRVSRRVTNQRQVGFLGWLLGLSIFFSDYFSPLFVGPVMRDMTDRFRISREKLAYICDSTSASVITLVPISSWAVYLGGLAITATSLEGREAALSLFIRAVPFNLYCILTVIMVLLIVLKVLPDFGPMRTAEDRTNSTGKVLRDGAVPMMGRELTELEATTSPRSNIVLNFLLPVTIIVVVNITTFIVTGSANVLGSFLLACAVLGAVMWLQRIDSVRGLAQTAMAGIKGVMPAVVILALAYCINHLSQELGTARYVVSVTESWMAPALVPTVAFVISAFISFATGTSWGTYAIMVPIALPLAVQFSGDVMSTLTAVTFAAVAGGGVFGDHCSPLSDTTVLSSLGSACDHIDHTRTQLPYALSVAAVVVAAYLIIGQAVT
jgi:Na+/H+ antiporter NhaC